MLDWSQCAGVERVGGKASGAWLFKNTRVAVDDFLEWFPGMTRGQAKDMLEHAASGL